jgi:tetratricopeptide (TPR) repeat protein
MSNYTFRDIERLLGLSRTIIQGLVEDGFVSPARGKKNELRFSFQDLILLRTAQGLAAAKVPPRKIKQSLAALRAELPSDLPLSGIRISALGTRVVVRKGESQWQADSGQYLLDFEVAPSAGEVAFLKKAEPPEEGAEHWFARGCALEAAEPKAAEQAYRTAIGLDPRYLGAYVNLGVMMQTGGRAAEAERLYRQAIEKIPEEPLLHFNRGIALEDLHRGEEALAAYERTLALDAQFADAHYNLARLLEARGRKQDAIRHLADYRRLQQG